VGGDHIRVNSETFLVTDFINLKIKPAQSFKNAHKGRMCARVFIGVSARTYINIYICTVFLKKITQYGNQTNSKCLCYQTPTLSRSSAIASTFLSHTSGT
jgi:hypothetical protein